MKWNLDADYGTGILAAGSPTATQVSCTTGDPVNTATLTDTAGGSGLQDNGGGSYTYVWKTSKAWAGTCQLFTLCRPMVPAPDASRRIHRPRRQPSRPPSLGRRARPAR